MSDPGKYRTADEIEAQKKLDPLMRAREQLKMLGRTEEQLGALDAEIEAEVQDAVKFADESEEPGPDLLEPTTYHGPFAR
jgi:pyruvate dehydrogenase E1 component alpha subunit